MKIEYLREQIAIVQKINDVNDNKEKDWKKHFIELKNIVEDLRTSLHIWVGLRCFTLNKYNIYYGRWDKECFFNYKNRLVLKFAPKLYKKFMRKINRYIKKYYPNIEMKIPQYCNMCGCLQDR